MVEQQAEARRDMLQLASSARRLQPQLSSPPTTTLLCDILETLELDRPLLLIETFQRMDVPFSSSGAMSRAHYALVRKIESATPQAADQLLLAEVQSIRHQLGRSTLTLVGLT